MSIKLTNPVINTMTNSLIPSGLIVKLNYIIYGMMIGSTSVILLTTGAEGENSTMAFVYGYRILLCSIIFLFTSIWYRSSGVSLYKLFLSLFPLIMLMVIISWLLVLLYKYFDRITSNKVSDYYVSFVNISTILTLAQLFMLMNAVTDTYFENNKSLQPKTFSILILFGTINIITVITLGVILKSYVTDC